MSRLVGAIAMLAILGTTGLLLPSRRPGAESEAFPVQPLWVLRLRLGRLSRTSSAAHMDARRAYLLAFERARGERSTEGVLRVAEAFAALGDRDVVHGTLRVARALASTRDPGVRQHVQLEAARIAAASAPRRWVKEDQWTSN